MCYKALIEPQKFLTHENPKFRRPLAYSYLFTQESNCPYCHAM